jgi:para-aminobenzoate synthetase/4-amino-4-deoxychorismate lyase
MSAWTQLPEYLRTLAAGSPDAVLLETSRFDEQNRHSYLFLNPVEVISANTADELHALFQWIESCRRRGLHLAGYFAYECGYLLESRSRHNSYAAPSTGDSLPLAWLGAYAEPFVFDHAEGVFRGPTPPATSSVAAPNTFVTEASLDIPQDDYSQKIHAIQRYIEAGDTYQVNFTDSVTVSTPHGAAASFAVLSRTQPVAYSALLSVFGHHILSLSPELFFRIRNGNIVTRPMKGTMSRGLDLAEDERQMARLQADEKNRSEHVMIVDLLRNDLGRICRDGSVHTDPLFAVERYRTLLQMTSTISGELRPNLTFEEIFYALFPCGSITGAPKIRTMQIIQELERQPRGVYTGAIGHIAPSGDATFNVAIRTLVLRDGVARMGVGGGIVADSEAASEYRECQLKASFLTRAAPQFQLIETMLFDGSGMPFLPLHLDRLASSAAYFEFNFDRSAIESRIEELTALLPIGQQFRLRLLLSANGEVALTHTAITQGSSPWAVRISPHRVKADDILLRHKTTQRELYDREYARARQDGFDEAIFLNEKEELAEGAISTLFVKLEGRLVTPPLASGVLPGVFRRHILATEPGAGERPLGLDDLRHAEAVYLGNSVRGLRPVARIEMADSRDAPILFASQTT